MALSSLDADRRRSMNAPRSRLSGNNSRVPPDRVSAAIAERAAIGAAETIRPV